MDIKCCEELKPVNNRKNSNSSSEKESQTTRSSLSINSMENLSYEEAKSSKLVENKEEYIKLLEDQIKDNEADILSLADELENKYDLKTDLFKSYEDEMAIKLNKIQAEFEEELKDKEDKNIILDEQLSKLIVENERLKGGNSFLYQYTTNEVKKSNDVKAHNHESIYLKYNFSYTTQQQRYTPNESDLNSDYILKQQSNYKSNNHALNSLSSKNALDNILREVSLFKKLFFFLEKKNLFFDLDKHLTHLDQQIKDLINNNKKLIELSINKESIKLDSLETFKFIHNNDITKQLEDALQENYLSNKYSESVLLEKEKEIKNLWLKLYKRDAINNDEENWLI